MLFDGISIGTFAGGTLGAALVVSLNGFATTAAATALVQAITYENTDVVAPTAGARTVQFVLTDGDGGTSTAADTTVTVSGSNSAPAIAGLAGDALPYTEGDGPLVIEQGGDALVTDVDSSDFAGGALTVSIAGGDSAEDVLSIRDSGTPGTGIEVSGADVLFDGISIGTFAGGTLGADLVVSLNGGATAAAATALVQAITYENTDVVAPTTGARTVQFVLADGDGGTSTAADATVTVSSGSNAPPVMTGLAGDALAYTEGDGPVVIEQGGNALVTDIDSADFDTGALTVSIAGGDPAEDVLSIRDSGTPGTGIETSGATVLFDGTAIGTFAGGTLGAALVVSLNGFATASAATALVQAITYENTDVVAPTAGARTVQFVLTDGDGGTSTAADTTVTVSGSNSSPAIAGLAGDALPYTEGDGPVVIEQGGDALVTDVDSSDFAGGALTVSIAGGDPAEDVLSIRDSGTPGTGIETSGATVLFDGTAIGTFAGGTLGAALVVSLNGFATAAAATALVGAVTFEDTDVVAPTTGVRTVQFVLTDGDGGTSTAVNATVTVSGSNSAPVIVGVADDALPYTAGDGPVVIEQGGDALVTDTDSPNFDTGALTVSIAGGDSTEDVLSIQDSGTPGFGVEVLGGTISFDGVLIGTFAGGTLGAALVVSLNGFATAAAATALVQAITYENTDAVAPTASARTVQFVLTDGDGGTSTAVNATVTVSGSNSAPVIAGLAGDALPYTEGDGPVVIEQGGDALVTDVDSADFDAGALTVSIAVGDPAEDVLSIRDSGTPGTGIEVSGNTVLFDGTSIGTFAGGTGGAALVVSLNGFATTAAATALARAIAYENTDVVAPTPGPRTVQFVLTDGDGGTSTAVDTTVTVSDLVTGTLDVRVSNSTDDAEERVSSGAIKLTSSDLEMTLEKAEQIVGLRFNGIDVPKGAIITSAYIQFQADEASSGIADLTIHGEDVDNALQFSSANFDISSRAVTTASALWQPADWTTVGEAGPAQQTVDLSAVIQEIIDRDGWVSGNSLALLISGSGKRVAESYNGVQNAAPLLHVEYQALDDGAPVVDLDADDSSGTTGDNFAATFLIGDPAQAIADTDVAVTDSNGATLELATITLTNPEAGDTLLAGSLPSGILVDGSSTATNLVLTGTASLADYGSAISAVTFNNVLPGPVTGDRNIEVVVNDGTVDSAPAVSTISVATPPSVVFWTMGDTPYSNGDFGRVETILSNIPEDVEFVVHVGDINAGSSKGVDPAYYQSVADLLKTSSVPVFIIPGDNEYNDKDDPDAGFAAWEANFDFFENNWAHGLTVNHQAVRDENFSFISGEKLFIGINLVGGRIHDAQEWADRSADDLAWIESNFADFGDQVTSAVIFGHAAPSKSGYEVFESGFVAASQAFTKPILYLMGDAHTWTADIPYSAAPNLTRIIIDRTGSGSAQDDPLKVSLFDDPNDPYSFDHEFDLFLT
ncbi:MAG: metallophosphoesterase [Alphaproteobacteria bacterium]|nr:metallophosphoesterase [Alphaproteobacteria bacterium]